MDIIYIQSATQKLETNGGSFIWNVFVHKR